MICEVDPVEASKTRCDILNNVATATLVAAMHLFFPGFAPGYVVKGLLSQPRQCCGE